MEDGLLQHKVQRGAKGVEQLAGTTTFRADLGHYETGLLWWDENVKLPVNVTPAKNRLMQLVRNLDRDTERARAYKSTMDGHIQCILHILCMLESYLMQRPLLRRINLLFSPPCCFESKQSGV